MLNYNVKEYELIRSAIDSTRTSLSADLSYVIGGSGILCLVINSFEKTHFDPLSVGLISLFSGTLIAAFFYLALYKFNSVNRYAGYSKLINSELSFSAINPALTELRLSDNFIAWEICASKLANATWSNYFPRSYYEKKIKFTGIPIDRIESKFKEFNLFYPTGDRSATLKGLKLLLLGIEKKDKSVSWKYPMYVSYIYYSLIFFFVFMGISNYIDYFSSTNFEFSSSGWLSKSIIGFVLLLLILKVIINSFKDLYRLMLGSKTDSAYCWKFLPFRIFILNKFNIMPEYVVTDKAQSSE